MVERDAPTFNLKAVVQETGIKPDTLRAWERRYGLPEPERSPGGHRLYSQRDIEILQWLMARQEEGLTISRAVDLWNTLKADGEDPLRNVEYGLREEGESTPIEGEELSTLAEKWVDACLRFDERSADRVLTQAFAIYPVETVVLEILQNGLHEIGEGWFRGEVSVQQEHFATALASRRLDVMLSATPPPTRPGRIIVACPPQEEHAFAQMLLTLLLRRRGWDTIYLGANVPFEQMEQSIEKVRPQLVILTAQRLATAANLYDMARIVNQKEIPVAFGGRIFIASESLTERIPGYYLGASFEDAVQVVEELIPIPPPRQEVPELEPELRSALSHFQASIPLFDLDVSESLAEHDIPMQQVKRANLDLAQDIAAALRLGHLDLVGTNAHWLQDLLEHHEIPESVLQTYLDAFRRSIEARMEHHGDLVLKALAPFQNGTSSANGSDGAKEA